MPLLGTLEVERAGAGKAELPNFDTEPCRLEGVTILHVMTELDSASMVASLPPALHPTCPPSGTIVFWSVPASPFGPFRLAQVRVGCRAGTKLRGYVVAGFVDSDEAAHQLAARWGFGLRVVERISLSVHHDRVRGLVVEQGRPVIDVSLLRPHPISGSDIYLNADMHLAHTPRGLRLVQVDPDYEFHRADRGRPRIDVLDDDALGDPNYRATWPISATASVVDLVLPRLRYLCDPALPARQGTETT